MKVTIKFYERFFKDKEDSLKAYLKACKWLAKNVVNKVEAADTTYNITKVEKANYPTFKLELYCSLEESGIQEKFCEICKSFHKSFYINQEYNCNACKMKSYIVTIDKKLLIKKSYKKERLNYVLEK